MIPIVVLLLIRKLCHLKHTLRHLQNVHKTTHIQHFIRQGAWILNPTSVFCSLLPTPNSYTFKRVLVSEAQQTVPSLICRTLHRACTLNLKTFVNDVSIVLFFAALITYYFLNCWHTALYHLLIPLGILYTLLSEQSVQSRHSFRSKQNKRIFELLHRWTFVDHPPAELLKIENEVRYSSNMTPLTNFRFSEFHN